MDNSITSERISNVLNHYMQKEFDKSANKTCLFCDCNEKPIYSHSISRNQLKAFADKNHHLYDPFGDRLIGLNEIGCFYGFCKSHDNDIFESIDNFPYRPNNKEQEFLFFYRILAKQISSKLTNLTNTEKLSAFTQNNVLKNFHPILAQIPISDVFKENADLLLTSPIKDRQDEYNYLQEQLFQFNQNLTNKRYNSLTSIHFRWQTTTPIFVSDTIFFRKYLSSYIIATLSIFPQNDFTYVVLSWPKQYNGIFNEFLYPILEQSQMEQQKFISEWILADIENIVSTTEYWKNLPPSTQQQYDAFKQKFYIPMGNTSLNFFVTN